MFVAEDEKRLVEEVFNNAVDCLSDEDKKLPQVRRTSSAAHDGGLNGCTRRLGLQPSCWSPPFWPLFYTRACVCVFVCVMVRWSTCCRS